MAFTSESDLINRMGKARLVQCTDDDEDGVADPAALAEIYTDVDAEVKAILIGKGFTPEQLVLMEADKAIRRHAAWIGADFAMERRSEFKNDDGSTAYTDRARQARIDIGKYATGELRSTAEPTAGKSANLLSLRTRGEPKYIIRANPRDPDDQGPGGF